MGTVGLRLDRFMNLVLVNVTDYSGILLGNLILTDSSSQKSMKISCHPEYLTTQQNCSIVHLKTHWRLVHQCHKSLTTERELIVIRTFWTLCFGIFLPSNTLWRRFHIMEKVFHFGRACGWMDDWNERKKVSFGIVHPRYLLGISVTIQWTCGLPWLNSLRDK